jgi:hypothetical protein
MFRELDAFQVDFLCFNTCKLLSHGVRVDKYISIKGTPT